MPGLGLRRLVAEGLSFPDEFVGWIRPAIHAAGEWLANDPPALVFASGPPFSAFPVAMSLAKRFGARLVLDFRDPWGQGTGSAERYRHPVWKAVGQRMERDAIARADLTLFNSPGLESHAARHLPQFVDRFMTIVNGTEAERSTLQSSIPSERPLRFSHIGAIYVGRNLRSLVRGLIASTEAAPAPVDLVVEQIGPQCDVRLLGADLVSAGGPAVRQIGVVSRLEALDRAQAPGVLVVVQGVSTRAQIPSKVFDYLATGNPIVVIATEDSAVWELARGFDRCRRLDLEHTPHNVEVLRHLVARWRSGELVRERAVEDTEHLSRVSTGRKMIDAITTTMGGA